MNPKDFTILDEEIANLKGIDTATTFTDSPAPNNEAWTRIPASIKLVRKISPSKRYAAELSSYDYWGEEGIAKLVFPRFGERSFSAANQFISGNLIQKQGTKRPIRVDILRKDGDVSSILAPTNLFHMLPLSVRLISLSKIAGWLRKHPQLRSLVFIMLGFTVTFIGFKVYEGVCKHTVPLLVSGISSALGAIILNLFTEFITGFLATRFPEDAQLVERGIRSRAK
jgi:hypothetical protein